ncbi:hypothetical protein MMC29_003561, partial [Sticta canariensis]|nr:hypothetical protein [Sticta canariensis]
MRLFLTFFVWHVSFIPAPVLADWSVNDISSNPTESPPEDGNLKQASQFEDGFGSELIAGLSADCAPDSIQFTGKLRARMIPCPPPSTSIDGNGKNPKTDDGEESQDDTGKDGNGHEKYPGPFILVPPRRLLPPLVPDPNNLCPQTKSGMTQYIICHEGLEADIHDGGDWIQNAIW